MCDSVGGMLGPLHLINQAWWHRPFAESSCDGMEGFSIPEQTGTLLAGFGELHLCLKGFLDASNRVANAETGGCSLDKQAFISAGNERFHLPPLPPHTPWAIRHGKTSLMNPRRRAMMCCEMILSKAMVPGTGLPPAEAAQMCC